jgi:hypothetical protein
MPKSSHHEDFGIVFTFGWFGVLSTSVKKLAILAITILTFYKVGSVRSHHLVLRLGANTHHARVATGDSFAKRVFVEKGLHIFNICCS